MKDLEEGESISISYIPDAWLGLGRLVGWWLGLGRLVGWWVGSGDFGCSCLGNVLKDV